MTDFLVRLGVPRRLAKLALPVAATLIALLYPLFVGNLFSQFPSTRTAVVMLVYMMMAVGLNIVVGYAGLLDLGYVAFYAMGAYTAAWFSSIQFPNQNFHLWDVGVGSKVPGFHVSVWLLLPLAGILTAIVGVMIGLPTLRLRGDYLAIVTLGFGEIMPQIARNGDNLFGTGFNLTNGPNGITPLDSPGFGTLNYLQGSGTFFTSDRLFYWTALVLLLITIFFVKLLLSLRRAESGTGWLSVAAIAGGVVYVVFDLSRYVLSTARGLAPEHHFSSAEGATLFDLGNALTSFTWGAIAMLMIPAGLAALRTQALPRWLAWSALVVGLANLVWAWLPPGGTGTPAEFAFLLWIVAASLLLIWRPLPESG
jgi:hypothetical protein